MKDLQQEPMFCECLSPEHNIRFMFMIDKDPRRNEISVDVHMSHYLPWYRRAWMALKYTLGIETRSHYDTFMMSRVDAVRLRRLLEEFEAASNGS